MSRLNDGFSTLIEFELNPSVKLWEKEVTPPGIDGGGANDTTTMRNTRWRTMQPKKLFSLTPMQFTAAYDTAFLLQARQMINVLQRITVIHSDGSKWIFQGWLNKMTPGASQEGSQPTAQCEIIPSNQDSDGNEVEPIYVDSEGDTNDSNNP